LRPTSRRLRTRQSRDRGLHPFRSRPPPEDLPAPYGRCPIGATPGATDTLTLRVEARRDGDGAPAPGGRGDRHPQAAVRAHLATIGHVESADTRRVYGAVLQRFAGRTGPAKPERLCARAVLVPMAMFCP